MTHLGKIVIKDNKVYFEPDGLEKPLPKDYDIGDAFREVFYNGAMAEYEASKQLIEVSNVLPHLLPRLNEQKVDIYYDVIFQDKSFEQVKNNQRCEAEVNKNEAVIVKIN